MRILRFTTAHRSCHLAVAFATVASLQVLDLLGRESPRPVAAERAAAPSVSAVLDWLATMKEARPAGWRAPADLAPDGETPAATGARVGRP